MSQIDLKKLSQCTDSKQFLRLVGRISHTENRRLTLLGVLQTLVTIGFAASIAILINSAVFSRDDQWQQPWLWVVLTGLLLLRAILPFWQTCLADRASIQVRSQLRQLALNHCQQLQLQLESAFSAAELSNLISTEIDSTRDYFAEFLPQQRLAMIAPVLIILATLWCGWLVPLILCITAPLVPLFMILVGHKAAQASQRNIEQLTLLGNLLTDRIKSIEALQLAGSCVAEKEQLFSQSEQYRKSTMEVLRLAFLSGTLLEFFSAISVALVAVYLGLLYLDKYQIGMWLEQLTLTQGIFLLILAPEFYLPLRRLGTLYHAKAEATGVAEHLLRLFQIQKETDDSRSDEVLPKHIQQIDLDQLLTGYEKTAVSAPLSCSLKKGQITLLQGPSGSGKSTLLDTIAGLKPALSGDVFVDGQCCAVLNNKAWQSRVGYMTQKPELLFDTIRNNLCLGREFPDEVLYQALNFAEAEALVKQLPDQLDYLISDNGGYLSGGQAQRISLARVFLHHPALLLLDEPIASLDEETATALMTGLKNYTNQGGIVLLSSHRQINHPCDQIIELAPNREVTINA